MLQMTISIGYNYGKKSMKLYSIGQWSWNNLDLALILNAIFVKITQITGITQLIVDVGH
jgi:hypothetical protein